MAGPTGEMTGHLLVASRRVGEEESIGDRSTLLVQTDSGVRVQQEGKVGLAKYSNEDGARERE